MRKKLTELKRDNCRKTPRLSERAIHNVTPRLLERASYAEKSRKAKRAN